MAMMPAFQWGQGGQALTPEQAKRQRAVAEALMGVQTDPQNMWEGIQSAVGQIGGALQNTRLDAQESEARAQVAQALAEAQASGDPNALLGVIGNDWASDAERQIASLLYEQSQPKDPLEVNGQLVDPNTFEVLGDFRNAPEAPKPLAINDQLVDPTTGKVIGDFRDPPAPGFAPLTAEEAASLGLPPGAYQRGPDNRIYEIGGGGVQVNVGSEGQRTGPIPPGMAVVDDPNNPSGFRMEIIPGGPAAQEAEDAAAKAEKAKESTDRYGNVVIEDIDRAVSLIRKDPALTTGLFGSILSNWLGSPAHSVKSLITTVKSNAGFDRLQAMRDSSPTGGALGQVSNIELELLQAAIGNLEQSQNDEQLLYNLRRVQGIYNDIVHGPGNTPAAGGAAIDYNAPEPPPEWAGDPTLWQFMSPEDRALW